MSGVTGTTGTITGLTAGSAVLLRVLARNAVGYGVPSTSISLTPAVVPSAPVSIVLASSGPDFLTFSWSVPLDTGIGDQSVSISSYLLTVDEGFGSGFVALST